MKKHILIFIIMILSVSLVTSTFFTIKYKQQADTLSIENSMLKENHPPLEPIEIEVQKCMKSCDYTTACLSNCILNSADEWRKEIDKNIKLLKEILTEEEITLLTDSQSKWLEYKDSQQTLNRETIGKTEGSISSNILAAEQVSIIERRAKELRSLYFLLSE